MSDCEVSKHVFVKPQKGAYNKRERIMWKTRVCFLPVRGPVAL